MPFRKPAHPLVRAARFALRALLTALKIFFFAALVLMPIPIFFKPKVPSPDRRNQPTEVRREE